LEEWQAEHVDRLPIDQLADDLVELELISGLVELERLRRIAVFERRGGPDWHGYPSMTAFLKDRCRMAAGRAHRAVARSRVLTTARSTLVAWSSGRLSSDQATLLLDQAVAVPDQFVVAEDRLSGIVSDLTVTDTRRALGYWRQMVDGPGAQLNEIEEEQMRGISVSPSLDGMVRVDGWMTRLAGQALISALDALMPPPVRDDTRTPRQRRHDALEDLARNYLENPNSPTVGGEKPHVNLICDLPALQGMAGGLHEAETGQLLTISQLRTIVCDCSLSRIVLGPNSEIIDVGRRTRIIPTAIRRAVIARDRHCTWPGCDRNPRWCDIHHIRHWANGGATQPANLRLLCRYHHSRIHRETESGPDPPHRDVSQSTTQAHPTLGDSGGTEPVMPVPVDG
jgi:hypothetical protein